MNTSQPDQTPLQFDELLARCMGEVDFAHKILRDFLNSSTPLFDEIKTSLSEMEMPVVAQKVHRLKGTAATVAAHPLLESLVTLERMLRDESEPAIGELDAALAQSVNKYLETRDYIELNLLNS